MNSYLTLLVSVAGGLMLFEVLTRRRRRNPSAYTLATHYTGHGYSTEAYFNGRHICTAVHIDGNASRRQALASARNHVAKW